MMSRVAILLAAASLFLGSAASIAAPAAHAQTPQCSPPCGPGTICVFTDLKDTQTACVPAESGGEVSELVVTASSKGGTSFKEFVYDILKPFFDRVLIPLLYALAFIVFLIGMVRFFFMGGEEARIKGRAFMLWGIVAFVVIFAIWGIVNLLLASFSHLLL